MRRTQYPWLILVVIALLVSILFVGTHQDNTQEVSSRSRTLTGTSEQIRALEQLYQQALQNGEKEVVIYQAAMDYEWQPIWQAFEKAFPGLRITYMHVSPGEVANRLDTEKVTNAHYADIISFPINNIYDLKNKDYLESYIPETIQGLPEYYQSADHQIHFAFLKVYGLGYNKNRLGNMILPKNIQDLLTDKWRGKFEYGAPGGGAGTVDIALVKLLETNQLKFDDLYTLKNNGGTGGTQEFGIITLAQARTVLNPWAYLPPLERQKQLGVPIDIQYIDDFSLLVPFGQGLVKNPAHPNAARLLLSWLYTPDVQQLFAKQSYAYSTMPNAPKPNGFPESMSNEILDPRFYPETLAARIKYWVPKFQSVWFKK